MKTTPGPSAETELQGEGTPPAEFQTTDPGNGVVADRKTVWVVDDDETTLMLAEEILPEHGFRVRSFHDSAGALAVARSEQPDIIVLDVMMPGLDGFDFCRRLRADPGTSDIPVLMVTSLNDSESIAKAYEAGATNFATKPISWVAECHRLRYLLRAAETARQLKVAEREARIGREDWERTFNAISDIVTVLSPELTIIRANAATEKAVKKPLREILGVRCFELFVGATAPCPECPVAQAIRTGKASASEKYYRDPGAECLVIGTPLWDGGGRLLHIVHIARDLTEQKALLQQYLQAQKMEAIGTLAGGVAHDFNNLLAAVTTCAELLRESPVIVGDNREFADTILDAANRGASLARQLLTFSRRSALRDEKHPLQLNDVVSDISKMLGRIFPKSVAIETRLAAGLRLVEGSADQLGQVLMNLATNAMQAMPNGGVLRFETRTVDPDSDECRRIPGLPLRSHVVLAVSDTGHGMDSQIMKRMFEPFFTTKKLGEGTGLGLAVVYGILKDHGGHVTCASEPGVGTTFTLYLPSAKVGGHTAAPVGAGLSDIRGGNETILLVDDDASVRTAVRASLLRLGYSVSEAGDGENALRRYAEGGPVDLVVMDLAMPGVDGWECLRRLRAMDPGVRVLLITGHGGQGLSERARSEGAASLVEKPFKLSELLGTVRQVLDQ